MNHNQRLLEFLKKENITPKNLQTYILATTHKSYNIKDKTKLLNYERLEFLGDSLLLCNCHELHLKNAKS
ncbi:hypothetical protein NW066_04700 [Mycoplasmopsis felis]|uniref:hypothetical protein n=1 Tax=Mycoplasmopsis felis TaxID=33923 RepID=UPI0021AE8ED9|nr:hypothetical protein [Mycoplasmopsis felis]UWV84851.1 hypothetical protein NW066_04700 [Mycoplasmopsis felis]